MIQSKITGRLAYYYHLPFESNAIIARLSIIMPLAILDF